MASTTTTAAINQVSNALRALLPSTLPPTLNRQPGNLYEVLSRTPGDGIGKRVYQTRWRTKAITNCYWQITRARLKCEGKHGKAWGKLYWKGALSLSFLPPLLPESVDPFYSHPSHSPLYIELM